MSNVETSKRRNVETEGTKVRRHEGTKARRQGKGLFVLAVCVLVAGIAKAQETRTDSLAKLTAPQAVAEGNRLLRSGDPEAALKAYAKAEELEPEAAEIPFVQGLAHFKAKRYDEARGEFTKVVAAKKNWLANDAMYSLGTCDHAEALETQQNPQAAIARLESAMQHYHGVLAKDPKHKAARDANAKAAQMWRQLKEQLEQQKQQQRQDQQNQENQEQKESQDQKPEEKEQQNQNQEQEQQQQPGDKENQSAEPKQQESQQKEQQPDQQQQKESSAEQKDDQPAESQEVEARQEQVSREQAQRRLREMMQALQQRKKARLEKVEKMPAQPVEKDW